MLQMQGWEIGLWCIAAFVATAALVHLMRLRRDTLTERLLREAEEEHRRQQIAERKAKQKQKKAA